MWYHPEDYQVHEEVWYPEVAQVQASWAKGAYTVGKGRGGGGGDGVREKLVGQERRKDGKPQR